MVPLVNFQNKFVDPPMREDVAWLLNKVIWILRRMESWMPPIYMASTNQFQTYYVITISKGKPASGALHLQTVRD